MAKKVFKKILSLCYDEAEYEELHKELVSLEVEIKRSKEFNQGIEDAIAAIPIYTDDFPEEVFQEIQEIYEDYIYSLEN